MTTFRAIGLLLGVLVLGGCATTNVDRAKDLSSAGVRYAQATSAVIGVAIDAMIDADSAAQVRARPRPGNLPPPEQRKKDLDQLDANLVDSVVLYTKLRSSIGTLEAYFQGLQALADGSQAEATQAAVTHLADRVNALNQTLESGNATVRPVLSEAQKGALGGLSKLVAKQIHGAVVGQALERDAAVIGRALLLQQQVLAEAENEVANRLIEENNRFYVDRVLLPYQKATIDAAWVDDRRAYLKAKALGQSVKDVRSAQAAASQMQAAWRKVLSGDFTAAEVAAVLKETDELLAAAVALKAAEKPKAAGQ